VITIVVMINFFIPNWILLFAHIILKNFIGQALVEDFFNSLNILCDFE
jgi:hypothetical protein